MTTQITHSEGLDQLAERICALEKRVSCLELSNLELSKLEHSNPEIANPELSNREQTPTSAVEPATDLPALQPNPTTEGAESSQISGALTVGGKALLGIAGAYFLRALSGSSVMSSGSGLVPRSLVAAIAVAYALAWLVAAARTSPIHRFAGVLYASTSALILAPMLWEMTLRFHVMPAWVAAVIVAAYACAATALAWRPERSHLLSAAYAGCALTALALLIGTRNMAPFTAILLTMLIVCEFSGNGLSPRTIRPVVAIAADLAVWTLLFIYRSPFDSTNLDSTNLNTSTLGTNADYPPLSIAALLAAPLLLFAIQAASVAAHTGVAARKISVFESVQSMAALLLAACGIVWFLPASSGQILGTLCLALSAICYFAAFTRFRHAAEPRNFRVFSAWAGALFVCGLYMAAPQSVAWPLLACAAVIAVFLARRLKSLALEIHGVLFLAVAAGASGLVAFAFSAMAGQMPPPPAWPILVVAVCAPLVYAGARETAGEPWPKQLLHFIPAMLAGCTVAALLTRACIGLAALVFAPDVFHIALIRTVILCLAALTMAFGGARLGRLQMTRSAYAAIAFVAAKLLFEDLRHGHMAFIAASIGLVAVTLIAVPRLARRRRAA
jgi:hypothetical protein